MSANVPPNTAAEFNKFIDRQIDSATLSAALTQARDNYKQALAQQVILRRQLTEYTATKSTAYSYQWLIGLSEIVQSIVANIDALKTSQLALSQAQLTLWAARRAAIAQYYSLSPEEQRFLQASYTTGFVLVHIEPRTGYIHTVHDEFPEVTHLRLLHTLCARGLTECQSPEHYSLTPSGLLIVERMQTDR